jgi:hypothetical protein
VLSIELAILSAAANANCTRPMLDNFRSTSRWIGGGGLGVESAAGSSCFWVGVLISSTCPRELVEWRLKFERVESLEEVLEVTCISASSGVLSTMFNDFILKQIN